MESSTPIRSETLKLIDDSEARIAVAILAFPQSLNALGYWIFNNAIVAGVRRKDVDIVRIASYFRPVFAVVMLTVNKEARSEAVETMKETLKELGVLDRATIATFTADGSWLTIHGMGIGGIDFEKVFMSPESIAAAAVEMQEMKNRDALSMVAAEELFKKLDAEKENPDLR